MSKSTVVNGIEAAAGCWIDGAWGWRAVGRLCSLAADFGWKPGSELDEGALTYFDDTDREDHGELLERVIDMADEAEDWLNDHTPNGFVWHWFDGEFFLSPYVYGSAWLTEDVPDDVIEFPRNLPDDTSTYPWSMR